MIELPLILASGMLGSAHCLGMCGPFTIALASRSRSPKANLARQLIYTFGRVCTYMAGGAAAGFGGWRLMQQFLPLVDVQSVLAFVAGLFLIWQGLSSAGWLRFGARPKPVTACASSGLLRPLLQSADLWPAFVAGLFTGFLPCGLVYAFLALAGSSGSVWMGMATMGVFGLGTAPAMLLLGAGGGLLSASRRLLIYRLAAVCVIIAGAMSIARGVGYMPVIFDAPETTRGCPLCH